MMIIKFISSFLLLGTTTTLLANAEPDADKVMIWCNRSKDYDFSIHVENAFNNDLFIFLNGSYRGLDAVSQFTQAFGKGNVTYLSINEQAWDKCQYSATAQTLHCALDTPISVYGERDFDSVPEEILKLAKLTLHYELDAVTGVGKFIFEGVEQGTQLSAQIKYELPCPSQP